MAPAPLKTARGDRLGFITYYKGEYKLHTRDTNEPMKEVEQDVRSAAEGLADFQPDVTHDVVPENKRRKKLFEGLYLEGRPPINVGVTSSGDFFGGTAVALTDTLGDQLFSATVLSVASYRIYQGQYANLSKRLHYGINLFDQTYFFYPYYAAYSQYYGYNTRDLAIATQRFTGGQAFIEYPLDMYRRLEVGAGIVKVNEQFGDENVEQQVCQQNAIYGLPCFLNNGWQAPVSVRLVQETTRFAEFGPLSGSTFSVGYTIAPGIGSFLQRQTVDADARKYLRLGPTSALLALRARGFYSTGDNPDYFYFGGNMELRGYPYYGFAGNQGFFANAEFRTPLINLAATPIGILGPLRGTVFLGVAGAHYKGQPYNFSTKDPGTSYYADPVFGTPVTGWRLQDGRASWGFGLQLFFLGYPLHFDWVKYTDFKTQSPGWDFSFWLGYDF
jgi:outer membrane protein assembly factor BamA